MLPLLGWILWRRRDTRPLFAGMFVVHLAAVLATGWGDEWLARLLESGVGPIVDPVNIGPYRFIGSIWIQIGLALAVFLSWKDRKHVVSGTMVSVPVDNG